jgi:hypothetical protein
MACLRFAADELWTDEVCKYLFEAFPTGPDDDLEHLRMWTCPLRSYTG